MRTKVSFITGHLNLAICWWKKVKKDVSEVVMGEVVLFPEQFRRFRSSEQALTFRLLSRSRNIPCATRYCEPATAGQVSSSESEHCYFGTGDSDLLFIFATVPRESEHTLCHAVLRARNSWQVSSSESEHCYFGTGGSDLLFIFATVPRESEHTLCHAVLRARNSWQVSSSESEHCYFGTGGSDLLFIFATVPRPEQFQNNCCVIFYPSLFRSAMLWESESPSFTTIQKNRTRYHIEASSSSVRVVSSNTGCGARSELELAYVCGNTGTRNQSSGALRSV
ncbi:hypothetical protein ANN_26593 [Periplaneta americana]|uniref:Uncharacterized protein n=1 Tax=Periplaneta americana TaxID=6978 RepID=A0ABQ8RYJ4_PERAM|nr:hypothetical protein ANN_26593 [Periplaneta americana]